MSTTTTTITTNIRPDKPIANGHNKKWEKNSYNGDTGTALSIIPGYMHRNTKDEDGLSEYSYTSAPNSYQDTTALAKFQTDVSLCCKVYGTTIARVIYLVMFCLYTTYFVGAILFSPSLAQPLIVITAIVAFCIVYAYIRDHFGDYIYDNLMKPAISPIEKNWDTLKWWVYPGLFIALILLLTLETIKDLRQLQSLSGITVFVAYSYITCKYPNKIIWRPVIWGYALQFVFALFVLRTWIGYYIVDLLANEITKFMNYAYEGAATVYGDPWMVFHSFTFMGMSLLIYMGSVMNILYYYGITQAAAAKMAWGVQKTLGTTAIESLGVASNIFLDGSATMLMLKDYLHRLTDAELHTLDVGGHSTIAGFVFGLFVLFGAPPEHLLSAAVMSCPAVFAITKLNYPESQKSTLKRMEDVKMQRGSEENAFEASANGAAVAAMTAAAVITNYISFLGMLAFVDATLMWIGSRVGFYELNFDNVCKWLFFPIALLIGTEIADCDEVGRLIGLKILTTEIYAYQQLGISYRNGNLSERSRVLCTYAMCGFSSMSTLAIALGVWRAICPSKVTTIARQIPRALINSNLSCLMTACIAGLLYNETIAQATFRDLPPWADRLISVLPSYKDLMGLIPGLLPDPL